MFDLTVLIYALLLSLAHFIPSCLYDTCIICFRDYTTAGIGIDCYCAEIYLAGLNPCLTAWLLLN